MQYEKKVIAYLDLLGFKDFIHFTHKTANDKNKKIKEIYDFFNFLRGILNVDNNHEQTSKSKVISHFSDLIVISFSAFDFESFYDEIRDLQIIIANCLNHGFFVRGSVIYGDLVHTSEIIFGPGLIEAYLLEKEKSIYPRVIVDETIVKDFNDLKPCAFELNTLLSTDDDGQYYVDYFSKVRDHLDHDQQYKTYIKRITKLLLDMKRKPHLEQKLEWIFPRYQQMLISVNFIREENIYTSDDLWHIYESMKADWKSF